MQNYHYVIKVDSSSKEHDWDENDYMDGWKAATKMLTNSLTRLLKIVLSGKQANNGGHQPIGWHLFLLPNIPSGNQVAIGHQPLDAGHQEADTPTYQMSSLCGRAV